ncbi:MAG: ROK family transcriptional regulator, partial [Limnochordia bacterium]|nr:ROK family transcriptional regulator [Limnochordia bacterium]
MSEGKNPQTTREYNQALILSLIGNHPNIPRVDLARLSKLSKPVVTAIVDNLMAAGLVKEGRKAESTVGRRPVMLNIATDYHRIIGIDLSRDHVTLVVTTLTGEPQLRLSEPFDAEGSDSAKHDITDVVLDMVRSTGLEKEQIVGIGVGHPFPLSASRKLIIADQDVDDWKAVRLGEHLKSILGVPVHLDNDANLSAMYERWYGKARRISDFVYVMIGNGVGAGIYNKGRLVRGFLGFAGEIGHITVVPGGERCVCGKEGCLETEISLPRFHSILQEAEASGGNVESEIHKYALKVGRHMGNIVNIFNPQALIIGGAFVNETRIPRNVVE